MNGQAGSDGAASRAVHYRLVTVAVSSGCEMLRWSMQWHGLNFVEERHVPLFHVVRTLRLGAGKEVPIVITPDTVWQPLVGNLGAVDAFSRRSGGLYGPGLAERMANQQFLADLLTDVAKAIRQLFYHQLLPQRQVMIPLITNGAPLWERTVVRLIYPIWRRLLAAGMGITPATVAAAPGEIEAGLQLVEQRLAKQGTRYLAGAEVAGIDICVAALLAPLVLPARFGGVAPTVDQLPPDLADLVLATRARRAGVYVLDVYEVARDDTA